MSEATRISPYLDGTVYNAEKAYRNSPFPATYNPKITLFLPTKIISFQVPNQNPDHTTLLSAAQSY